MSVDRPCGYCDDPHSALLRIVLISEILCADDDTLYALVDMFEDFGLLQLSDPEEPPDPEPGKDGKPPKGFLRRVK